MYKYHNKNIPSAVALRYDDSKDQAPSIVASGKGKIAEKIIQLANEHDVPIYKDSELVEILSILEINTLIPVETYGVIAEILSYIYSKNVKSEQKR